MSHIGRTLALALITASALGAQSPTVPSDWPQTDSNHLGPDGTVYMTRVIHVPTTVSPEAAAAIAKPLPESGGSTTLAQRREATAKRQEELGAISKGFYPANVASDTIAGVPVRIVTPLTIAPKKRDRVMIELHGGGFVVDAGSLTETIPIANLTGTKVIGVIYSHAPEKPYPAGLNDAIAVYKEVLKTYKPNKIAIYGTSAGAILTAQTLAQIKHLGLPMPGAAGIFSGIGDFSQIGDSIEMYNGTGLKGKQDVLPAHDYNRDLIQGDYAKNLQEPVLSPLYMDATGFPPTLFITSTRDFLLSGTAILQRHYLQGGVEAQLIVFEGLPHAFWGDPRLPESKEAYGYMAKFLDSHLEGRSGR